MEGVRIQNVVLAAGKTARFGRCLPEVSRKLEEINGTAGRTVARVEWRPRKNKSFSEPPISTKKGLRGAWEWLSLRCRGVWVFFVEKLGGLNVTHERPKIGAQPHSSGDGCMYIYIYAVGSITWPHFRLLRVNILATYKSITWPPFFANENTVFFLVFWVQSFQGMVQHLYLKKLFLVKKGFSENGWCTFFWGGGQGLGKMLLDALEGCSKKTIKIVYFWTPSC